MGGGRFTLVKKLGAGSFGEIWIAHDRHRNDVEVALKLEIKDTKHPQLVYEAKLLQALRGSPGVAEVYHFGIEKDWVIMAMELAGPSLEDVFNLCHRSFSLKTTIMLTDELIRRIEFFHAKSYIHR